MLNIPLLNGALSKAFILCLAIFLSGCDIRRRNEQDSSQLFSLASPWQSKAELAEAVPRPSSLAKVIDCRSRLDLPNESLFLAHATNYGVRQHQSDIGKLLPNKPELVVIHETVIDEKSTIRMFQTPHQDDSQQVSYHMLVARDGSLVRIVPDANRAYGAGKSHFGGYTIRSKKNSPGSINNVALHISLVSPPHVDNSDSHSGYTDAQYSSLAGQVLVWQMKYQIPLVNITTHQIVDRSHSRYDPRSFDWSRFDKYHNSMARLCGASYLAIAND